MPWRRSSSPSTGPAEARTAERSLRLRRVFDETQSITWRMLRRFGVPASRIEDTFQQVYLITSERLDDIRPGRERAFVYGVVLRIARSYMREGWRELPDEEPDLRASLAPSADTLLGQRRLVELCDQILGRLTPEIREVFILHEIEGFSGVELARLLEIPEGTVHSRLRRARIQVRAEVEALGAKPSPTEVHRG
ncbi:MAG: RNA polymerase sigma factor [Polyangiaceae bacterium]